MNAHCMASPGRVGLSRFLYVSKHLHIAVPGIAKHGGQGVWLLSLPDRGDISDDSGFGGKHRRSSWHDEDNGFGFLFWQDGHSQPTVRAINNIGFLACCMANVQSLQSASVKVKFGNCR